LSILLLLKFGKNKDYMDLEAAKAKITEMKNQSKGIVNDINISLIKNVVFACDAGMGSSVMGAAKLQKQFKDNGLGDIKVTYASVSEIPKDAQIVITHNSLKERASKSNPNARIIGINDFLNAPEYTALINELKSGNKHNEDKVLKLENIIINLPKETLEESINRCGALMLSAGYVQPKYIEGMIKRDKSLSVAIGNQIAIPHGENEYRKFVKHTGIVVLTYSEPID
jgi:PTS system mannitol-specific IIC component